MKTTTLRRPQALTDDAGLVERFKAGDAEAFDEIVCRHRQMVYLVARRLVRSHADADEAAQLAFIRAWKARGRFRGDSILRTWLTRIVLNVAKSMRSAGRPLEELKETDQLGDPVEGPDERMRKKELRTRVRNAVSSLPPRQQQVVTLKVFSEMTYKEVAEVMGLSEGSIKAHLHQAVTNLRKMMISGREAGVDR